MRIPGRLSRIAVLGVCLVAGGLPAGAQPGPLRARKVLPKGMRRVPPGARLEMLDRMSPEERERFLNSLPAARRAEAQRRLEEWRRMTPQQRARLGRSLGEFRGMPPERQRRVRALFVQFNNLPAERQPVVRNELATLRALEPEAALARLHSEEFRGRFSPSERQLLTDLVEALPGPAPKDAEDPRDNE